MASLRYVAGQSKIDALWKQVLDTFKWTQAGTVHYDEEKFASMKRQVDNLTAEDISLEDSLAEMRLHEGFKNEEAVGSIQICNSDVATMQVFVLHKDQHMPIHDHPNMIGILKVIKGCVRVNSYTLIGNGSQKPGCAIVTTKKQTVEVCKGDPACVLTPSERNYHSIVALNGEAAFLDVLSPPYFTNMPGHELNVCNYYKEVNETEGFNGGDVVRLQTIPPPEDYWTVKGNYRGPEVQRFSPSHRNSLQ
ncbi:2-aminoethanethiol dioxygenase [Thrips palmi]|uniref:2-aminoethanethiol dioxygenase n=1 Tax=Thrips palmi TaxID=161013 RepID=A0A6P9AA86_THRPL|nr:2-aminoethanethiol dioxygenase [Thrips palmi]